MCMSHILIMHSICNDDNEYIPVVRIYGSLITDCCILVYKLSEGALSADLAEAVGSS